MLTYPKTKQNPTENVSLIKVMALLRKISLQAENGKITPEQMDAFVEHKNPFGPDLLKTTLIDKAIEILGDSKIITAKQASQVWNTEMIDDITPFIAPYTKSTLLTCRAENKNNKADWRLIYINGFSLMEQIMKFRPSNKGDIPSFRSSWVGNSVTLWSKRKPATGYRLIDFRLRFNSMNWEKQEKAIAKLGKNFARTCDFEFAESIISIFLVNNKERIEGEGLFLA